MIIIKYKLKSTIIILLIIIVLSFNIMILHTKADFIGKVLQKQLFQYFKYEENFQDEYFVKDKQNFKDTTESENFLYANINLRKYYLDQYLKTFFNEKTLEENLFQEFSRKNKSFEVWTLNISNINLFADIKEGTSQDNLNKYIGHFEETNFFNGNVGLAAHNRGYEVNYFKDLDKLKIGEVIDYRINNYLKKYKVFSINIIKDTDWTYLQDTNEDIITLITCVKNKPEYRLCVQAHKESEEILNYEKKNFNSRFSGNFIIKCDFSRIC